MAMIPKPERKTREEFMFGSEPIVGYRIWKVGKPSYDSLQDFLGLLADAHDAGAENPYRWALGRTNRHLLMPIASAAGGAWLPGVTEARCTAHSHKAPALQCECGFWALRDKTQLVAAFDAYQPDAWGTVKLWGRFCEFEKGYRAQYAYPDQITLLSKDDSLAYELAAAYGCTVGCGDIPEAVSLARAKAKDDIADISSRMDQLMAKHMASMSRAMWSSQMYGLSSSPPKKKWWQV